MPPKVAWTSCYATTRRSCAKLLVATPKQGSHWVQLHSLPVGNVCPTARQSDAESCSFTCCWCTVLFLYLLLIHSPVPLPVADAQSCSITCCWCTVLFHYLLLIHSPVPLPVADAQSCSCCRLLLQVAVDPSVEGEELAMAFGSTLKDCRHLLECAKELELQVVGAKWVWLTTHKCNRPLIRQV